MTRLTSLHDMSIEIIFSDLDGCLLPKDYDSSGAVQDHRPTEKYFEYYRSYTGPQIVPCTGRSWEATTGIMARLSHFPSEVTRLSVKPVICENGARIVLDSREAEEVSVVESLECDLDRGSPVSEIRNLSEMLLSCSESIRKELERRLNRPVTQLQLPPKKYMATVDVPFDQLSGERVPQQILLEVIFQFLPTSVRKLIEEKQILISSSRNAIDIHLPIRKIDGVRFLLKKYGVERTKIAYIGDAESDIEGLVYAHVGCCPANADGPVKRCVRQKGRLGYVSPFSYAEGVADSLKWIRTRVPDMYMCGATEQDRGV